jgi:hypothetical protein
MRIAGCGPGLGPVEGNPTGRICGACTLLRPLSKPSEPQERHLHRPRVTRLDAAEKAMQPYWQAAPVKSMPRSARDCLSGAAAAVAAYQPSLKSQRCDQTMARGPVTPSSRKPPQARSRSRPT